MLDVLTSFESILSACLLLWFLLPDPSFKVVPCPGGSAAEGEQQCVFVSFFAFGEGAQPGEAGVVAFVNKAPTA